MSCLSNNDGRKAGARICLANDSTKRGVIESQTKNGFWTVRFADMSCNIRAADLKLLPFDAASFDPSKAPLDFYSAKFEALKEAKKHASTLSVTAYTNECAYCRITLITGTLGPEFAA